MTLVCTEGQEFGKNYNPIYSGVGLKGHPGQDWSCGWMSIVEAWWAGLVYKVFPKEAPASDGFTAVNILVDDNIELFEYQEGHCEPTVSEGSWVAQKDPIGKEANHGPVYSGNILITLAMQAAGNQAGHHRHVQKRPLYKVRKTVASGTYLTTRNGAYFYRDGFYYQVADPKNGYAGCVDPTGPVFARDLYVGCSGYDVYVLQRFLASRGILNAEPTGFYGPATCAAVISFQRLIGILPNAGYFGPKTRAMAVPLMNLRPFYAPIG